MRLNQFLAKHIGISRRNADEIIKRGEVKVNHVEGQLHNQIEPNDMVQVLTKGVWKTFSLDSDEDKVLLLYKPIFTMTTRSDPEGRKTIYDLLPSQYFNYKPAGRLDYMSEGLLVLSPNGHLLLSMTHPKFKTKKVYIVGLQQSLSQKDVREAVSGGIEIDGYELNPVEILPVDTKHWSCLKLETHLHWYEFILTEGRNQQIRKMAKYFGNKVQRLIRIKHGRFAITPELKKETFLLTNSLGNDS